ncbi:SARP family transcriptional regulator [Rhizocola hellebori]|uniref:SARP family transcriptional regulator n=1 Tax=Rhizocola hellebori TaxID=1392758 RepID=A0A8J3VC14_9ACTN|nr:BTAD domain-containing putative transcriptional regulator [Rhizocola hellebori]GIH02154.1 SARP family transcriptional regulator [Rhizocola hellebori]
MELRLLGPVELWAQGTAVHLGTPRQRGVLAALAVDAGRLVEVDMLIDRVWDKPPQRVRQALWVYVSQLRAALRHTAGAQLVSRSGGYLLDVEPDAVDFLCFRRLTEQARGLPATEGLRAGLLGQALGLWRGQPLAGLSGSWARRTADAWRQQHLDALVVWAQAETRMGNPGAVVAALTEAVGEHPLAESPVAALMLAYHGLDRNSDALEQYLALHRRLAEELGTDPMPRLQQIHRAILRGEPMPAGFAGSPPDGAPARSRRPLAAQLPAGPGGFSGRTAELDFLSSSMLRALSGTPVCAVVGTAGVGKTALALRWAHRAAGAFPDGQLFIDLYGFDPVRPALDPAEALQRFLRALGVDPAAIPSDMDEAAALYRSHMSDKRMLVVLDNAFSDQQVRPLLPGAAGSAVVVTSRHLLRGLVAHDGARLLSLEPMAPAEALDLLLVALAHRDERADLGDVAELARLCCCLPLALRVAAAHLTVHPQLTVAKYVAQLAEGPLSILDRGDEALVTAALDLSYRALAPPARRLFLLLGVMPGQEFGLPAAAAVLGGPLSQTRRLLDNLCAAHLVAEREPGRYRMHDLLRHYCRSQALRDEPEAQLHDAQLRLVDFYAHTIFHAYPLLGPGRVKQAPVLLQGEPAEAMCFDSRTEVLEWFDAECENILGVIAIANGRGWHASAWNLVNDLFVCFTIRRRWSPWRAALRLGLASAEELDDPQARAYMENGFGVVHKQTGDYPAAQARYLRALELATLAGNDRLVAAFHVNLGGLAINMADPEAGIHHLRTALSCPDYSQADHATTAYVNLGCALIDLGRLDEATETLHHALALSERVGDAVNACHSNDNLTEVALRQGDAAAAQHHAEQQLQLARRIGDPVRTAAALDMLASAVVAHDPGRAHGHWLAACELFGQLNHRVAPVLQAWLAALEQSWPDPATLRALDSERRGRIRKLL